MPGAETRRSSPTAPRESNQPAGSARLSRRSLGGAHVGHRGALPGPYDSARVCLKRWYTVRIGVVLRVYRILDLRVRRPAVLSTRHPRFVAVRAAAEGPRTSFSPAGARHALGP